jgi:hypothetical protein
MDKITYKRSLPVKAAKVILDAAHRVLPKRMYNLFYGLLRRVLWAAQRAALRSRVCFAAIFDKKEAGKLLLVDKLLPYTMGGSLALASTFDIVALAEKSGLKGDLVECGVAKGGCSAMMALASRYHGGGRKLWLFDSYEGLPAPTEKDFRNGKAGEMIGPLSEGMLVGTVEQVSRLMFDVCALPREDVKLVKGWFQDTLPGTKGAIGKIAVLRLDGDWYESTMCCLKNLYDIVTPGGFVIIDDYATCYGSERAVTEFLVSRGVEVSLIPDGRGGAWFKKPEA